MYTANRYSFSGIFHEDEQSSEEEEPNQSQNPTTQPEKNKEKNSAKERKAKIKKQLLIRKGYIVMFISFTYLYLNFITNPFSPKSNWKHELNTTYH